MLNTVLFNAHDVILLLTAFQSIVLAVTFFFLNKAHPKSGVFALAFFLVSAAAPLDTLINFGSQFRDYAIVHLTNWFYIFELGYWLQGPFLLWYVRSLVHRNYRFRATDYWFFGPFVFYFFHQVLTYYLLPAEGKILIEQQRAMGNESISVMYMVVVRFFLRLYFGILCIKALRRYLESEGVKQAPLAETLWLRCLVLGTVGLWAGAVLIALLLMLDTYVGAVIDVGPFGILLNYLQCVLLGAVFVAMGLRMAQQESAPSLPVTDLGGADESVQSIDPQEIQRLEQSMAEKQWFLDATLTLDTLAKHLSISPRALSSLINRHYQTNFHEFVNKYRIDEAKRRMLDTQGKPTTILDIMYEVGFNSKTTFNSTFKKMVGVTPREFKKQHLRQVGDAESE